MSKRIDQIMSVVSKTVELIRSELKSADSIPVSVAESLCNRAISITAAQFHVTNSTISSKCVREIGFKSKQDFFNAIIDFITLNKANKDRLRNALLNHDCFDDGEWYINRKLDAIL